MTKDEKGPSDEALVQARQRPTAAHLQSIEDSPPSPEQTAMSERFEREGWSHERRLAHIRERARSAATLHAAE
ncbi:hypothetical protein [Aquibium sp. ELW1220]|uniref:hypothetical protein n=1 Tax=Aquibium sp. ELW1220 TaxID=2976766 RepID=UPI0025B17A03|nr:hypothetical protein [Aquibium sp. ELW1220]MDN2583439.1 hypothetical protein [Aquibium sp. ELW1220]